MSSQSEDNGQVAIQEKGGNKKLWIHAELENGTNCRQHQEESSTMSTKRINNGPLRRRPFIQFWTTDCTYMKYIFLLQITISVICAT